MRPVRRKAKVSAACAAGEVFEGIEGDAGDSAAVNAADGPEAVGGERIAVGL